MVMLDYPALIKIMHCKKKHLALLDAKLSVLRFIEHLLRMVARHDMCLEKELA